jgi:thioredoxin reductase (NADPH)
VEKLLILGGGPAGLTASLFAGQSGLNPLVIEGNEYQGQIASVFQIENYPGFPEGISGKDLSSKIHQQAEQFGTRFNSSYAVAVDLSQKPFRVTLADGQEVYSESIVIATGASPRWLGVPGESEHIGHGVSSNATLDAPKFKDKEVVVVGGGDSTLEYALLLSKYASQITIVCKYAQFNGAKYLQERVFNDPKINLQFNSEVTAIEGVSGEVSEVKVHNLQTKEELLLPCKGVFVTNGRKPNTDPFIGQLEMNENGYIITKPNSTITSTPGVFAAGDITLAAYRNVTIAVASGCMSSMDAKKYLSEKVE